ncbi:MAG: NAD-dependent epimerase/dehydratase family protein, partial [Deltaproteobacteria bacterium]|nr:NAD-dependent epimerase/dehydratase family protein [Deltaproteobacteria bacterium]
MNTKNTILVAGAAGMVGSAIVRALLDAGHEKILGTIHRTEPDFGPQASGRVRLAALDLMDPTTVRTFFMNERPHTVILAAARVGGIKANADYPAEFIYDNLMIACNVIHAAHLADVQHLLFLGSSCIYPRLAPQPMAESALLTGPLEPTNEPY